jgi:signal transduction histidine kinase
MKNQILKRLLFNLPFLLFFITETSNADNIDSLRIAIENIMKNGNKALISDINNIKFKADTIRINHYLTLAYNARNSNYDSLLFYSQKAIASSLDLMDLKSISRSVQMLGRYYFRKENYPKAGECYLLCLEIEEKNKNARRAAELNDQLGNVYSYEEVFEKALTYHSRALAEYEKEHDTLNSAIVYGHLGNLFNSREYCEQRTDEQKMEDFNQAIKYFEKSVLLSSKIGNQKIVIDGYSNIAAVFNKQDKPEKALPYIEKAAKFYRDQNNSDVLTNILHIEGVTYFKLKRYNESTKCFIESLNIGIANHNLDGVQYLYESMAQTYFSAKDYKNAYVYYVKYMTVKDSVSNQQKAKELFELETRYESQKKENEIVRLTLVKREKNIFLYALSGLTLTLCVLIYFIMKNTRNKKLIVEQNLEIKERQILELEKERQLIATKSVLKGEESERSRMARDLHDGLGGLLSGVKINLSSMKGNSVISKENANIFDQALKLLDTSIMELRRVAHSLMPETLNYYGLKTAFSDFISELNGGNDQILSFRSSGEDIRYDSQLELTLYRIAQELVNNALKHSDAKNIDLQLITEVNRVCVQVIDDGKGFDVSAISGTGKGLLSIRERVVSNNGRFDLESSPENGTEATVEFMV